MEAQAKARTIFEEHWQALIERCAAEGTTNIMDAFPTRICFLGGAPGSGKGTQTEFLREHLGITSPTILTSDLFQTPEIKAIMDQGILIDDGITTRLVLEAFLQRGNASPVLIDGYPRTDVQAYILQALQAKLVNAGKQPEFMAIALDVSEANSLARQQARAAQMQAAGKTVRATDLDSEKMQRRYSIYAEDTVNALELLGTSMPLHRIDANESIETVQASLQAALKKSAA